MCQDHTSTFILFALFLCFRLSLFFSGVGAVKSTFKASVRSTAFVFPDGYGIGAESEGHNTGVTRLAVNGCSG